MIRIQKSRVLIGVLIVGMLVIAATMMLPHTAMAIIEPDSCTTINGLTTTVPDIPFANWQNLWTFYGCGAFPSGPASCTYYYGNSVDGHAIYATLSATTCDVDSCSGKTVYTVEGCGPVAAAEPVAPSIFLSDVCQPNDGFGGDGYMTLDTDAGNLGVLPVLYYGASADGPWFSLDVNGPPYNLTMADLTAMAANSGAADYSALWVKVSETGRAMLLGDMIRDRAARMDDICGE